MNENIVADVIEVSTLSRDIKGRRSYSEDIVDLQHLNTTSNMVSWSDVLRYFLRYHSGFSLTQCLGVPTVISRAILTSNSSLQNARVSLALLLVVLVAVVCVECNIYGRRFYGGYGRGYGGYGGYGYGRYGHGYGGYGRGYGYGHGYGYGRGYGGYGRYGGYGYYG